MWQFLNDCQIYLKICGYCVYSATDALRYRWSNVINQILGYLCIYFIVASICFLCDDRQPYDERMLQIIIIVGYSEMHGAHLTFTAQRSNIFKFFKHFEIITNRSKSKLLKNILRFILIKKSISKFKGTIGTSRKCIDFYLEAERKTTVIKDYGKNFVIPYSWFLATPFAYTVIQKILIEKSASDPITWYMPLKSRYRNV